MKRTIALLTVMVLLCAAWTGGWLFVAGKIDEVVTNASANMLARGQEFDCKDQAITGFPFRISLNCSKTRYSDNRAGLGFEAGAMRTAAQAYQPGKAVVELEGPARLDVPNQQVFDIQWESLRASLDANLEGPQRFSIVGKSVNFQPADVRFDSAKAERVQLHGRKSGANDLELAIRAQDMVSPQERWPDFNLESAVRLNNTFAQMLARPDLLAFAKQNGLAGELQRVRYDLIDGGEVFVSGPFDVTTGGIVSGKFQIRVKEMQKLVQLGKRMMPDQAQLLDQVSAGLLLFAKSGESDGLEFPLTVRNGSASVGLIPVGQIPALF